MSNDGPEHPLFREVDDLFQVRRIAVNVDLQIFNVVLT